MIFSKQNKDRLKDQSGFCTGSWGAGDVKVGEMKRMLGVRYVIARIDILDQHDCGWSVYETG